MQESCKFDSWRTLFFFLFFFFDCAHLQCQWARRWVLGGALVYAGGVVATLLYLRASRVPAALSAPVSEPQQRLAA